MLDYARQLADPSRLTRCEAFEAARPALADEWREHEGRCASALHEATEKSNLMQCTTCAQ